MYKSIKHRLGQISFVRKIYNKYKDINWFTHYELRDIWNSYFARPKKMRMTPFGFNLVGSNSVHHVAMQTGKFEADELELFKRLFLQSELFVDVGANIGFYTCLARSMGLHVVAVEPLVNNLKYLFANLSANNWEDVEVFPLGVSDRSGVATLYGASSTGASLIENWAGATNLFHRTIPLSTLDILLGKRFAGKKIFIKVDVEGAEYLALQGAVGTMCMYPKPIWIVETSLDKFYPGSVNPHFQDVFDLFWKYGYEARTADGEDKLIQPEDVARWVKNGCYDFGSINYKFTSLS